MCRCASPDDHTTALGLGVVSRGESNLSGGRCIRGICFRGFPFAFVATGVDEKRMGASVPRHVDESTSMPSPVLAVTQPRDEG